jgi:hypothetical protein
MSTELEKPAVTESQDSAPTALPELSTLSPEQRQSWRETGEVPQPKPQESAPAKKDAKDHAAPDSAPESKDQPRQDSAPDKSQQKPQFKPKTKEDTEKRFQELTDRLKKAEERAEAAERRAAPEKREPEQKSQPAPEPYKRLDEKEFFAKNPKATYEDYIDAAIQHGAKEQAKQVVSQELAAERQRLSQESAAKELRVKVDEGRQRYPDMDEKLWPALKAFTEDQKIPFAVKALVNDSDVLVDLMYVLASDATEFRAFLALAKTSPGLAIRKLVTTEALVKETLSGKKKPNSETPRGNDGKFQRTDEAAKPEAAAEPVTRHSRVPVEVGGRGSASEDGAAAAVKANDFRRAKQEFNRDYAAQHK